MENAGFNDPVSQQVFAELMAASASLDVPARNALEGFWREQPNDIFQTMIHTVQQFITLHVLQSDGPDYVLNEDKAVTNTVQMLDILFAAGGGPEMIKATWSDFENDGINQAHKADADYICWHRARKEGR